VDLLKGQKNWRRSKWRCCYCCTSGNRRGQYFGWSTS